MAPHQVKGSRAAKRHGLVMRERRRMLAASRSELGRAVKSLVEAVLKELEKRKKA